MSDQPIDIAEARRAAAREAEERKTQMARKGPSFTITPHPPATAQDVAKFLAEQTFVRQYSFVFVDRLYKRFAEFCDYSLKKPSELAFKALLLEALGADAIEKDALGNAIVAHLELRTPRVA